MISGFIGIIVISPPAVEGATHYVGASSTYSRIQYAIDNASSWETVIVGPGIYNESLNISKVGLWVIGNQSHSTLLRGDDTNRTVSISSDHSIFSGFTLEIQNITISGSWVTVSDLFVFANNTNAIEISKTASVLLDNVTVSNLGGNLIHLEDSSNITVKRSLLEAGMDDQLVIESRGVLGEIYLLENEICMWGMNDTGIRLAPVTGLELMGNTFYIYGIDGKGVQVCGARINITNNSMELDGQGSVGYQITYGDVLFNGNSINVSGDWSTGIVISGTSSFSSYNCSLDFRGLRGMGIHAECLGSEIYLDRLNITSGGESGTIMVSSDSSSLVELHRCTLAQGISFNAMGIGGPSITITGSEIISDTSGVSLFDIVECNISGSKITGSPSLHTERSITRVTSSYLGRGPDESADAMDHSEIAVLDSSIGEVDVDRTSRIWVGNSVSIRLLRKNLTDYEGVDLRVKDGRNLLYSTPHFNGSDPCTGADGMVDPILLTHRVYEGRSDPVFNVSILEVYVEGTADTWEEELELDASRPHVEVFTSPDIDRPMTPTGLKVMSVATEERLFLLWDPNTDDAIGYHIYSHRDGEDWIMEGEVDSPNSSWISPVIGPDITMEYVVSSWDGMWESLPTDAVGNTTLDKTAPQSPIEFFASSITHNEIVLNWKQPPTPDLGGFLLEMNRSASGVDYIQIADLAPGTRVYSLSHLDHGIAYSFRIKAYDLHGNPSNFSYLPNVTTAYPIVDLRVNVSYGAGGLLSLQKAENVTVTIEIGDIEKLEYDRTDPNGTVTFSDFRVDRRIRLFAEPAAEFKGIDLLKRGYLPYSAGWLYLNQSLDVNEFDLVLPFYEGPDLGRVEVRVKFGAGPRTGAVGDALVELLDSQERVVNETVTGFDGKVFFLVEGLPFEGTTRAAPPDYLLGEIGVRSGYFPAYSENFEVGREDPDLVLEIMLNYREYRPPQDPLLIISTSPHGDVVDLNKPLSIRFNHPVNKSSVETAVFITPGLEEMRFSWSDGNRNLTVAHEGMEPSTDYDVEVNPELLSVDGLSFPFNCSNRIWSFHTTSLPDEDKGWFTKEMYIGMGILIILFILVAAIYMRRSSETGKDEDQEDEEYRDDLGDDYPYDESQLFGDEMDEEVFGEADDVLEEFLEADDDGDIPSLEEVIEDIEPLEDTFVNGIHEGVASDIPELEEPELLEELDEAEPVEELERPKKGKKRG